MDTFLLQQILGSVIAAAAATGAAAAAAAAFISATEKTELILIKSHVTIGT